MLEINLPLLIVTAVIFLGLIFVLNYILYKPLLQFIDDRNDSIKADEESVSKNANDAEKYQESINKIIADARIQANSIKQAALDLAKSEASEQVAAKKAILQDDYDKFVSDLSHKKSEIKKMLVKKMPEFKSILDAKLSKI